MTIWNIVWGVLLILATVPYLTNLKTSDFAEGKKLIDGCTSLAFVANLIAAVFAVVGMYSSPQLRLEMTTTAFCLALVANGWRHQAIQIYEHREDIQLADKMAKAVESLAAQFSGMFTVPPKSKSD